MQSKIEEIIELKKKLGTLDVEISEKITIGDFPLTGRGVKAQQVLNLAQSWPIP